jgi:hypothetical protein
MEIDTNGNVGAASAADDEILEKRRRFYSHLFIWVMASVLPLTGLTLWLLTYLRFWRDNVDAMGLLAISVGILGILVFFMFVYKYQVIMKCDHRGRWLALLVHALIVLALFLGCIWLAFDSPWSAMKLWGDFDMLSVAKTWIISVLARTDARPGVSTAPPPPVLPAPPRDHANEIHPGLQTQCRRHDAQYGIRLRHHTIPQHRHLAAERVVQHDAHILARRDIDGDARLAVERHGLRPDGTEAEDAGRASPHPPSR